jgi:transcriptional regulator with XRE-family HTH domain
VSRQGSKLTLREARDRKGLSREKVAARISLSSKTLERMEKSNSGRLHVVEQLAEVYGLPLRRIEFEAQPARNEVAA